MLYPVQTSMPEPHPDVAPTTPPTATSSSSRFAPLKTDSDVEQAKAVTVPQNTRKNTDWAVNVWKDWSALNQALQLLNNQCIKVAKLKSGS